MAGMMEIDPQLMGDGFDINMGDVPASYSVPLPVDEGAIDYDNLEDDDAASEISNASSDDRELAENIARYDAQREAFVAQQRAAVDMQGHSYPVPAPTPAKPMGRPGRKGRKLGPRKAVKPTPDILFRLSLAKEAFERKEYEETITMIKEIIRINSETYNAWTLLSTVHDELGDREKATMCLMTAAHLVPKNVQSWLNTALYALHGVDEMEDGPEKTLALERALTCYSCALLADKTNIEARTGKADVLMMQGHAGLALIQYQKALAYRPLNIRTVRNMADVALDARDARKGAEIAKKAYRDLIDALQARGTFDAEEGQFEWSDLRIYLEFFNTLEQWQQGAQQLKEISRWLLGRSHERYWNNWVDDDREWDLHDNRRVMVAEFEPTQYTQDTYGLGLPVDLRAKLYVYRCRLGHEYEANLHLGVLDPTRDTAVDKFMDFPDCLKDIAVALLERDNPNEALRYLTLYKQIAAVAGDIAVDADVLVAQGRCYMMMGDKSAAEECFIAAIEDDQDHIEARVHLANMYEGEQEQEGREEAFLLVRQALNLELNKDERPRARGRRGPRGPYGPRKPREPKPGQKERKSRYVPRRLINAEKRRQQDMEMAAEAKKNYQAMEEARPGFVLGEQQARATWMKAAKELIDDFRSYKDFYPWDKYIKYLGYGGNVINQSAAPARNMKLAAMAERLMQNLAPAESPEQAPKVPVKILPPDYRGISFDKWLDIFLEYAFTLIRAGQRTEAYVVCHAARDSVIWSGRENTFVIHVAWAACAVYAGDEETCVAIARYFMRDYLPGTDSYRMFAAMCRICQMPVSWYTSGPAQKFILRQIKTMDNIQLRLREEGSDQQGQLQGLGPQDIGLDVCLLTIYGHILFSTTSYAYALSYFARAASLDPHNHLINLSTGLAYLHYALKRQATNRQYLLAQGFAFLFRYYHDRLADGSPAERQEAHFNIARSYSLIGLGGLAVTFYKKVLAEAEAAPDALRSGNIGNEDLTMEAAYNIRTMCYLLGDMEGAKAVTERWLVL